LRPEYTAKVLPNHGKCTSKDVGRIASLQDAGSIPAASNLISRYKAQLLSWASFIHGDEDEVLIHNPLEAV
jgi:hypothetical protein